MLVFKTCSNCNEHKWFDSKQTNDICNECNENKKQEELMWQRDMIELYEYEQDKEYEPMQMFIEEIK